MALFIVCLAKYYINTTKQKYSVGLFVYSFDLLMENNVQMSIMMIMMIGQEKENKEKEKRPTNLSDHNNNTRFSIVDNDNIANNKAKIMTIGTMIL